MIRLNNVIKQYDNFRMECSIHVPVGRITGLIGRNGAGKSTAFKAALGLIRTDGGSIEIFGKNVSQLTQSDREQIGVVLSDSGFCSYLTIRDFIPVLDTMYADFSKEKFTADCERMGLPLKKKIKEFSTGMKRKLQILAALSHNAKALILDEPTAGLDPKERVRFRNIISSLGKKRIVILSTHIVSDIAYIANQILIMKHGQFIMTGTPEQILEPVSGCVWKCTVTEKIAGELNEAYAVSNLKSCGEQVELRIVSKEKPYPKATIVQPVLEDAYLYYYI